MNEVHAVIELKITPQRDCGFGKIAERVSKFSQVEACFLMSGGYDLLVFVKGDSLQDVALFVAQDLSTLDGVLSTATHFMLKINCHNRYAMERLRFGETNDPALRA